MTARAATAKTALRFEIRSAQLPLLALLLRSRDIAGVAADLADRLAGTPGFYDGEALVIDATALADSPEAEQPGAIDLDALLVLVREHGMQPIAVRGGPPAFLAAARDRGLLLAPDAAARPEPAPRETVREVEVLREVEVVREVPAAATPTLVVDKPLRSGQQVYARGGDLVVLAAVNPGAEVIADGHVHVYAPLRGKAIAGARGNAAARIFALAFEPELVSIAGIYRTSETAWPKAVAGKPAQVRLDGEKLVTQAL